MQSTWNFSHCAYHKKKLGRLKPSDVTQAHTGKPRCRTNERPTSEEMAIAREVRPGVPRGSRSLEPLSGSIE